MAKFSVEVSRRFWQYETQTVEVEAKNAAEAKRIVREMLKNSKIDESAYDPGGGDCGYDDFDIQIDD